MHVNKIFNELAKPDARVGIRRLWIREDFYIMTRCIVSNTSDLFYYYQNYSLL
jgi:hypothetical protein